MKKYFVTGLVILLPLVITVAVIVFIVNFLTKPFLGFVKSFFETVGIDSYGFGPFTGPQVALFTSRMAILIGLFAFVVFLGIFTRLFFMRSIILLSEKVLHRIPVVKTVYITTQEIIKAVFVNDEKAFKKVVLVEFPQKGTYVLGLISREAPEACCIATGEKLYSVLVPTTPNPTTGFLMMYKESELIFPDMTPEEGIKYLVSCGVMTPTSKPVSPPLKPIKKAAPKKANNKK